MKKFVLTMAVALFAMVAMVFGGEDATNAYLTIERGSVNGTGVVVVTAYYPSSWSNRSVQEISAFGPTNNWYGISLSRHVAPKTNSLPGELPPWTRWFLSEENTNGTPIKVRGFRIKQP
jgi:hypothetical protein